MSISPLRGDQSTVKATSSLSESKHATQVESKGGWLSKFTHFILTPIRWFAALFKTPALTVKDIQFKEKGQPQKTPIVTQQEFIVYVHNQPKLVGMLTTKKIDGYQTLICASPNEGGLQVTITGESSKSMTEMITEAKHKIVKKLQSPPQSS